MPEYQVVESTETEKHYSELGMITENVTKEQGALLKEALCKGKIFLNISGEMAWYIMCNVPGVRKYMQSRYSHVFIDEYQDCGKIQHDIFLALCEMGIIGVAVGDVNQAIYGFTNRFPRYLLELIGKDDFEHFELSKNHRCHPSISEYSLCLYGISKEIIEDNQIYGIETNFYGGGGSKLNETARSYKMLSQEADTIDGFTFVWFTDGIGWKSAKGNLRETFDVMDAIYCIDDMENGVMDEVFVD